MSQLVREPKQERSRASFDRAVDAALTLMTEHRSDSFTLAQVAERAGVSTGSIYSRVDSKENLIRAVFEREMDRIARDQAAAFAAPGPKGETLPQAVARLVATMANFLRANAHVFAPFMAIGGHDPQVARRGKAHFNEMVDAFEAGLLQHRARIRHPEPERAARWAHTVAYSVIARWLGLGSEQEASGEGDWDVILADLSTMITAYLVQPVRRR